MRGSLERSSLRSGCDRGCRRDMQERGGGGGGGGEGYFDVELCMIHTEKGCIFIESNIRISASPLTHTHTILSYRTTGPASPQCHSH